MIAHVLSPRTPGLCLPRAQRNSVLSVTPGQLRTFAALAELGSVRAAADRLNVTESAVSASVAALQRQLGTALIERAGRGVRLTPAGARYAERTVRLLGELEEAAIEALGESHPDNGWLRIAAVTSAAEVPLPTLIAGFRTVFPNVGLELDVAPQDRVWHQLRSHAVDLAMAGRLPEGVGLVTYAVRPFELVVVAAPRLAGPGARAWLMREHGSGLRARLERILDERGIDGARLTLGSNSVVVAGAVAGLGATLVAREVVADELADGRLVEISMSGLPLTREYHLVGRRGMPPTARRFVNHVLASEQWRPPGRDV